MHCCPDCLLEMETGSESACTVFVYTSAIWFEQLQAVAVQTDGISVHMDCLSKSLLPCNCIHWLTCDNNNNEYLTQSA